MSSSFNKDWILVDSSSDIMYMELRLSKLLADGLRAVIMNRKDSAYNAFGSVEIFVHRDDFMKAKHLLEDKQEE
jgi:hypothetical protein